MKKIIFLVLLIFIYSCGYTSVYKDYKKYDLLINIVDVSGDYEINNYLKNDLKISSNNNSKNIYDIKIITNFEKITLAKDSTGKATDYKLDLNVKFIIVSKQNQTLEFNENLKIKNNDEKFEQTNYEKDIKRNFSKIIVDKLILILVQNYDN